MQSDWLKFTVSVVIVTGCPVTIRFFNFCKMATRFAVVTGDEIEQIRENSIPEKTKQATKYGMKIFQGTNL